MYITEIYSPISIACFHLSNIIPRECWVSCNLQNPVTLFSQRLLTGVVACLQVYSFFLRVKHLRDLYNFRLFLLLIWFTTSFLTSSGDTKTAWYYFSINLFYFPDTNMIFITLCLRLNIIVLIIGAIKFRFFVMFVKCLFISSKILF